MKRENRLGSELGTTLERVAASPGWFWDSLARGFALFLGAFMVLNVAGSFIATDFDANLWVADLRWLPRGLASVLMAMGGLSLLDFGIRPSRSAWRRWFTATAALLLMLVCIGNAVNFYALLVKNQIHTRFPLPLSLFLCAGLALVLMRSVRSSSLQHRSNRLLPAIAAGFACALLFPLAEMMCFGETDYERRADVAVVLGARVYADGTASDALADRVKTACRLYREGMTRKLLFSGGPGDGQVHETETMQRMAIRLGVRPEDILVDRGGLNTQATVKNSEAIFSQLNASRILVVSHFYHLPRIKLAYQRAGREVYTVPARESYLLRQMPYNMAREVAALWVYYLRPLRGASTNA